MTGWIIAGSIIVVLLALLMTSVRVRFGYSDELRLKISWLFITLIRVPAKTKKMKRRDKKAAKDAAEAESAADKAETSAEKETESGEKSDAAEEKSGEKTAVKKPGKKSAKSGVKLTLKDIFELVKLVWDSLSTPLKRLLKATRISGFRLNIVVGGDDAAKTAVSFGRINMVAGSALAFLDGCFTLKKPQYNVTCDFMSEETTAECEFTARLTLIAALAFAFWLLGRFVRNYLSRKDAQTALGKLSKK